MGQGTSSEVAVLESRLGYRFRSKTILEEALTHDSLRVHDTNLRNYQRLEHLGDSVLQLVITNYLYSKDPNTGVGQLSESRSRLVQRQKQGLIAAELELEKLVKMSQNSQGYSRYDKFVESLIGAVYIDAGGEESGYPAAKAVIYKLWKLETSYDNDYDDYDD